MNTTIINLNHALTFQLEGMYEIVKNLQHTIQVAIKSPVDASTKDLLRDYMENLFEQRLKLKRIFGYTLSGPYDRKSGILVDAIVPFREIAECNAENSMRDILFTTSMQAAIQFMITSYTSARYMAMRLELDHVVALLDEMLSMEETLLQKLRSYSAQQVNNACLLTPANEL